MDVAILGGTGDIGKGLALRWAVDTRHQLCIGSRKAEKAARMVDEYESELASRDVNANLSGAENPQAVVGADVVILAVPPYYATDTVESVAETLPEDAILVSPAVGMSREDGGMRYDPPPIGSVTEHVRDATPAETPVVGAFHNLPAHRLADLDATLGIDTVVIGTNDDAKDTVIELSEEIDGLRALDGGPLSNAPEIEALTPLLINVGMHNTDLSHVGVRFD